MPTLPAITRQRLALVGVTVALGATLAACEKPTPGVTVFSGKHSDHTEAICWSPDADRAVSEGDCSISLSRDNAARAADQVPVIPTDAGATVGISVDPVVAEDGVDRLDQLTVADSRAHHREVLQVHDAAGGTP